MIKKVVTYDGFDDEPVTKVLYFNLTRMELLDLEIGEGESLTDKLKAAFLSEDDLKKRIEVVKLFLGKAYGERAENDEFVKSDDISEDFMKSRAFDALLGELSENEEAIFGFMLKIMPKGMLDGVDFEAEAAKLKVDKPVVQSVVLPEEEKLPWADREPTKAEQRSMTRDQLMAVYARRTTGG